MHCLIWNEEVSTFQPGGRALSNGSYNVKQSLPRQILARVAYGWFIYIYIYIYIFHASSLWRSHTRQNRDAGNMETNSM